MVCLFVFGATAPSGEDPPHSWGLYIIQNDAPQLVGLLWTSDQHLHGKPLLLMEGNYEDTYYTAEYLLWRNKII